jgi:hypothetical protein
MQDPLEKLEKMYMEEFLRSRGHTWETVNALPEIERKKIMTEASTFVGVKLAEVEGKARIAEELHNTFKSS